MELTRRDLLLGASAAVLIRPAQAMAGAQSIGGRAFGSTWRVTAGDINERRLRRLVGQIVDRVDRAMSPYLADSDLSRFNARPGAGPVAVSPDLLNVGGAALGYAALTGGAFDPAVGPLVGRHGFGPIKGTPGRASDLGVGAGTITRARPGLTLDLCGIAKGYALDLICDALRSDGMEQGLVELGGEVRAIGRHPNARAWRVAVQDPDRRAMTARYVVEPGDLALATSGPTWNGISGTYATSHIIDPAQARPAMSQGGSVSVFAPTAMEADALATALCAMGRQRGLAFAKRSGLSTLFVTDGQRDEMTGDFASRVRI